MKSSLGSEKSPEIKTGNNYNIDIYPHLENAVRGLITGLVTAPFITLFANMVHFTTVFNTEHRFLILFLPAGAAMILFTYSRFGASSKKITSTAIKEIHQAEDNEDISEADKLITPGMGLISFFTAGLSHLLGASVGKEGAGVQIGFTCASSMSRLERKIRGSSRLDYYLMSGSAAAFSSLFSAPVAGTLFGAHLASPKLSRMDAYLPCLISSFTSNMVSQALHIHVIGIPAFTPLELNSTNFISVLLIAILVGFASNLTCQMLEFFKERMNSLYSFNKYLKVMIPALLLTLFSIAVFFVSGSFSYNGLSSDLISKAVLGESNIYDFLVKTVLVLLSLSAGFQGGEVVPLLVLGATLSASVAEAFMLPVAPLAVLGAVGFLSGGMKLPLVTFFLGMELFGYDEPRLLFVMTVVSFISSGKSGIYSQQRVI